MPTGQNEMKNSSPSQLLRDLGTQDMLVREIEDRVERLTQRIKPLLLTLPTDSSDAESRPEPAPVRSAFSQGVADQNNRLRAISHQLMRLENEIDL